MIYFFATLLGATFGGALFFTLFSWIARKVAPLRDLEPSARALRHGIPATLLTFALPMWGFYPDSGWAMAWLYYIPGVFIGWHFLNRDYRKSWEGDDLSDTFR